MENIKKDSLIHHLVEIETKLETIQGIIKTMEYKFVHLNKEVQSDLLMAIHNICCDIIEEDIKTLRDR